MAHPSNKWERRYLGEKKAHRRLKGMRRRQSAPSYDDWSEDETLLGIHRDCTKTCACPACVNPRVYGKLTLQELMADEALSTEEM